MPGRLLFLFFCSYTLISTGLSFKYYLEARPADTPEAPQPVANEAEPLFERAEEHFFSRRYNTSLALFLKVLEQNPEHGRAHSYCGDIYLIQKNYDEAAHHFRIAAEIGPEKHKAEFRLGQIAYLRKDAPAATEHLNRSLELSADFAPSVFYLGLVAWKLEDNRQEAAIKWEKYLSLRPQDPQRVAIQEAIEYLRTEERQPEDPERAPLDLDNLLRTAEPSDSALPLNNVPAGEKPESNNGPDADPSNTSTSTDQTASPSKAELDIARSLGQHPERLDTVLSLARIYSEQGQRQRSLELLEQASKNSDSPALAAALSKELAQQGRSVEARALLRQQIRRKDLGPGEKAEPALELARITQPPLRNSPAEDAERSTQEANDPDKENSGESMQPGSGQDSSSIPEKPTLPENSLPSEEEDFAEALDLLQNGAYRHLNQEQRKEYHLIQARKSFQQGAPSRAYAQTLQILKEDPTDKRGLILAAAIAYQSETGTSFEVYEERIRNLYGEDPDMMLALAALYRSREPEKYGSELKRLQKQFPSHAAIGLAFVDSSMDGNNKDGEAEALSADERIRTLESLLEQNPGHPEILSKYIEARLERGDRQPDLVDLLQRFIQTEQKHPGTFPDLQKWLDRFPDLKSRLAPKEPASEQEAPPASEKDAEGPR